MWSGCQMSVVCLWGCVDGAYVSGRVSMTGVNEYD